MLPEGKASALEDVTRFNEKEVLESHSSYIVRALEVVTMVTNTVVIAVYFCSWMRYGLKMWRMLPTRKSKRTAYLGNQYQYLSVTSTRFAPENILLLRLCVCLCSRFVK